MSLAGAGWPPTGGPGVAPSSGTRSSFAGSSVRSACRSLEHWLESHGWLHVMDWGSFRGSAPLTKPQRDRLFDLAVRQPAERIMQRLRGGGWSCPRSVHVLRRLEQAALLREERLLDVQRHGYLPMADQHAVPVLILVVIPVAG